jgi:chromosome partitioning protein
LLIDADPQANSTSGLGYDPRTIEKSIYECMVNGANAEQMILKTNVAYLDLLPSNIGMVGAEVDMIELENRETKMLDSIQSIKDKYEFIIIDCAPSLNIVTVNALVAANSVLVPVQCEYFALEGLGKLLHTIKIIQSRLNTDLEIEGILLTMYDLRVRLANQVVDEVKTHFEHLVFKTIIPRNVKLSESPSFGLPVIAHDAESRGAISYINLAHEILEKNGIHITK